MAESILLQGDQVQLEAAVSFRSSTRGVVITHPHPLYGGDMDNPVVLSIETAYASLGVSTLRFNFRGTGASTGTFDDGRGESSDVRAALSFLKKSGLSELYLSGYSFGTWVNAGSDISEFDIRHMSMVSPPVAFMDFSHIAPSRLTSIAITGSLDDIAPPASVKKWYEAWNPAASLTVINGADHFYQGYHDRLSEELIKLIDVSL